MFTPKPFQQTDLPEIIQFIRQQTLATVITYSEQGLEATHIPLIWQNDGSQYGCLVGHFFNRNSICKSLPTEQDWLIIFSQNGHYISANYYPSKQIAHKAVPTWNFQAVHCYGKPQWITDLDGIKQILTEQTAEQEQSQSRPWKLSDAPQDYIDGMCKSITAFKFPIERLEAKYKLSQNHSKENQQGVIAGLKQCPTAQAQAMAELVQRFGKE